MGNTMAIEESFFFFYLKPATGLQFIIERELFAGVMAHAVSDRKEHWIHRVPRVNICCKSPLKVK